MASVASSDATQIDIGAAKSILCDGCKEWVPTDVRDHWKKCSALISDPSSSRSDDTGSSDELQRKHFARKIIRMGRIKKINTRLDRRSFVIDTPSISEHASRVEPPETSVSTKRKRSSPTPSGDDGTNVSTLLSHQSAPRRPKRRTTRDSVERPRRNYQLLLGCLSPDAFQIIEPDSDRNRYAMYTRLSQSRKISSPCLALGENI